MESRIVDEIEILLWPHPKGMSAFAAPFVFDLEYDSEQSATIDASYSPFATYPSGVDRYGVFQWKDRAAVMRAAYARRDDFRHLPSQVGGYLVRSQEAGIGEPEFLGIVAEFIHAWRSSISS